MEKEETAPPAPLPTPDNQPAADPNPLAAWRDQWPGIKAKIEAHHSALDGYIRKVGWLAALEIVADPLLEGPAVKTADGKNLQPLKHVDGMLALVRFVEEARHEFVEEVVKASPFVGQAATERQEGHTAIERALEALKGWIKIEIAETRAITHPEEPEEDWVALAGDRNQRRKAIRDAVRFLKAWAGEKDPGQHAAEQPEHRRGAPEKLSDAEYDALAARWKKAKAEGVVKKAFKKQLNAEGISPASLDTALRKDRKARERGT